MVVPIKASLQVIEAELEFAALARHMVTAFVFVDGNCALRTLYSSILFAPLLKLFVLLRHTTLTFMRLFATIETHFCLTSFASHFSRLQFLVFTNIAIAFRFWAPA